MVRAVGRASWASFPVGTSIGFETIVADRRVVRSWARREPDSGRGLHHIRAWQEVDFKALNRPGGRARAIFDIACTSTLEPRSVTIFSVAGQARIQRTAGKFSVRLADGSRLTIDDGPWHLVLPDNVPALVAIYLHVLQAQERLPFDGRAMLTGTLQTIPYRISPDGDGHRTNLGEWFAVGRDGWLAAICQGPDGPEIARRIKAPPPRWRGLGGATQGKPVARAEIAEQAQEGVRENDVSMAFGGATFWGRLLRPQGDMRAAAFLIGGSGVHDRFGKGGAIDLGYRDIALGLAARGVAVLQVDKPGAGRTKTSSALLKPRFSRTIGVARAWTRRLRQLVGRGIPVFLIGHSEGGQVATVLAQANVGVAGTCLIATAYDEIDRVIAEQLKTDSADLGISKAEARRLLRDTKSFFAFVRANRARRRLPDRLKALAHLVPWYRGLLETAPARRLSGLRMPLLVLHGSADIQVAPSDAGRIARHARRGSSDVTVQVFDGLDHLMKRTPPARSIVRYGDRRRRVPKYVIDTIARWVLAQSAPRSRIPP